MNNNYENTLFNNNYSINIKGKLTDFSTSKVMAVVNLTPDSFYASSRYAIEKDLLKKVESFLSEGADFIDIGAFSSRPDAKLIDEAEEEKRLLGTLEQLVKAFPEASFSVDTFRSSIAQKSVELGAAMINDISAGRYDPKMFETIAQLKVPYIMMHMQGDPDNMQQNPKYESVFTDVFKFFTERLAKLRQAGVNDVIIDPGFGFGKTLSHNYQILKQLSLFHHLETPILVGLSRKGMIQKVIDKKADEALNGTTVANTIAILQGANILRVHDPKEAKEVIQIVDYYQKQ